MLRIKEQITVRKDLEKDKTYGGVKFYPGMRHLIGTEVTISETIDYDKMDLITQLQVGKTTILYHIAEDPAGYLWSEEMFDY